MRGHIRSRAKGSWTVVVSLGRDPVTNKKRQKWTTVKGTKRDAEKRLSELLRELDTGLPIADSKETVAEFMNRWLRDHVARTTRPRTVQFYSMVNRLYIEPVVGRIRLQKLTPSDVQRVIGEVMDRGLSPSTAQRAYATLHRALECGLKWGVVHRNVCDAIDAPKEADHEISPPDKTAVRALLGKAMQTRHGAAFWLLAYSGMRRGEVCSVKREHLDLEAGTLKVSSAVGRENSRLTVTPPKSKTSRRLIHLDSVTISVLRSHLARQAEHRLSVGPAYQDRGLVFASPTGDLLDPDILTRDWRRICKGVGVKYRLHDLRHAHVTALIEAGVHVKIIQSRVGHASPGFTLARYGHLMPGMDAAAAEAYARAMGD